MPHEPPTAPQTHQTPDNSLYFFQTMESVNKLLIITQNLSTWLDSINTHLDVLEAHQRDSDPVVIADKIKDLLTNTRLPFWDEILKNIEPLAKMEATKRRKANPLQWSNLQV